MKMAQIYDNEEIENDVDELDAIEFIENLNVRKIYERGNYFYSFNETEFFKRFRLRKENVYNMLTLIEDELEFPYNLNNSVSPLNQLLVCLRVYATGGHLQTMADFGGMHVSTVSRIVVRVSEAIARLSGTFIKFPETAEDIKRNQNDFYDIASFPKVVGVIDCSHIRIQSPGHEDAELFRNRKSYFSINVQAVGNANFEFINIVARWPGSSHDSTIFNHCQLRRNFEANLYPQSLLLGDSGYNVRPYLLTPLLNPNTQAEQLYNEAHIRTRAKIENLFGIWKRRFPIMAYGCRLKLETILTIIVSTAVLHNIARKNGEPEPPADENIDQHELQQLIQNGQIPPLANVQNQAQNAGFHVRRNLINDFFGQL